MCVENVGGKKKRVWMALATQDSEADGDARKLVGRSKEDQGVFNPWKLGILLQYLEARALLPAGATE